MKGGVGDNSGVTEEWYRKFQGTLTGGEIEVRDGVSGSFDYEIITLIPNNGGFSDTRK